MTTELKIARLRRGIQQKDMAQRIGLHYSILSGIECGRIVGNARQRAAILGELGGDEADFFDVNGLARKAE